MRRPVDPRSVILRTAEARQGLRNHTELSKQCGMKVSTLTKRFRLPGTMTLDEVRAVVGLTLTDAEAWELVTGRKRK